MTDDEALELALARFKKHPYWGKQIDYMVEGKPNPHGGHFIEPMTERQIAEFASSVLQSEALNLAPWETVPCHARVDGMGSDGSVKLLARMEAAGISRWHPSPLEALEAAALCAC